MPPAFGARRAGHVVGLSLLLLCWSHASDHQARITSPPDGSPVAGPDVLLHLGLHLGDDPRAGAAAGGSGGGAAPDSLRVCLVRRHVPDATDLAGVDALEAAILRPDAVAEGSGFESECFDVTVDLSAADPVLQTEVALAVGAEGWHLVRVLLFRLLPPAAGGAGGVASPPTPAFLSAHGVNIFVALPPHSDPAAGAGRRASGRTSRCGRPRRSSSPWAGRASSRPPPPRPTGAST